MNIRILTIKNGFAQKHYVQQRRNMLWIFPVWVSLVNPDQKEHFGTDFPTVESAKIFIKKVLTPKEKIVLNVNTIEDVDSRENKLFRNIAQCFEPGKPQEDIMFYESEGIDVQMLRHKVQGLGLFMKVTLDHYGPVCVLKFNVSKEYIE